MIPDSDPAGAGATMQIPPFCFCCHHLELTNLSSLEPNPGSPGGPGNPGGPLTPIPGSP